MQARERDQEKAESIMKRSLEEAGLNPLDYVLKKSKPSSGSKELPEVVESDPENEEVPSSSSESTEEKLEDLDCKKSLGDH